MPRQVDLRPTTKVPNNPNNQVSITPDQIANYFAELPALIAEAFKTAVLDILREIDTLTGLNLVGFAQALEQIFSGDLLGGLLSMITGNNSNILALIEGLGGTAIADVVNIIKTVETDIVNLPGEIEANIANALTGVENLVTNPLGTIEGWVAALEKLLGLGAGSTGGTGSSGGTVTSNTLTLTQLLGLIGTNADIPAGTLKALAPSGGKNVLSDPNFQTGSYLQGQGLWCWDSWVGTGDWGGPMGCVRTIRPGRITIYNIVGTSGGNYMFVPPFSPPQYENVNYGASGLVMAYLQIPESDPQYGWLHTANTWSLEKVDQQYFEWINVPYPAAAFPMGQSVDEGVRWLINQINQTPGPFFFTMDSQGNQVGSAVYDEIRFGSLQSRRNDFLGAVACGNLRREEGHSFPGCPDPAPGTSGMCVVNAAGSIGPYGGQNNSYNPRGGNLIDTEDLWWDFAVPGDFFACLPITGNTVVPPPDVIGGNVGDIGGINVLSSREFYRFVNLKFAGNPANIVSDVIQYIQSFETGGLIGDIIGFFVGIFASIAIAEDFAGAVYRLIQNLGQPASPHQSYYKDTRPLAFKGDNRTFLEIAVDYINSFIGGVHPDGTPIKAPPAEGVQHQLLGQRVASAAGDVITAGASVMWINVACPGPAIAVAVNAYDAGPNDPNANLIGTITADECVISNPEPSSNWGFVPLKADFVMPTGTQSACLVFDVYPDAMTTGIVWFDDAIFEPTNLVDGALLNPTTLKQITGQQVSGPQGIADMATFVQNFLDGLASANGQTQYTGTEISTALQSQAQLAAQASLGYNLGVSGNKILSNVSAQPLWAGNQQAGQSTFPLPMGTLPTITIAAGTSVMGFINSNQNVTIGFAKFEAKAATGSITGVYLNAYSVDTVAGTLTSIWSSSDLGGQLGTSFAWISDTIASASQFDVSLAEIVAWEIVSQNAAITVVGQTSGHANDPNAALPNQGASRTTSSTGGVSPATLTNSQITFGGAAPYVCMAVSAVPPNYEPPNEAVFASPGKVNYDIPAWILSGDAFDVTGLGGGGAGGPNNALTAPGQGGLPGQWSSKTLTYGTDIPAGTTQLTAIVGAGGNAICGSGTKTVLGYGMTNTPQFDAVGDGASANGTTLSWSHTAAAGAYVLVGIFSSRGTFNVTFSGTSMVCLGQVLADNSVVGSYGVMEIFGLENAPGGASMVTVTLDAAAKMSGNSISFTNVSCAGVLTSVGGAGTTLSQQAACGTNQLVVQAFGNYGNGQLAAFSGGTKCSYTWLADTSHYWSGLSLSYATSSTTFTATASTSDYWAGATVVLNPSGTVLLSAAGGQGGGGAVIRNPANPYTDGIGRGPGTKTWAGRLRVGGPDTLSTHLGGNFPGGGSAGGDNGGPPLNGANGELWVVARQGNSTSSSGGGFSGGGSELSVLYEATGTGGEEATSGVNTLSWTHTSIGGSNCAVVLIGAVDYSSGTTSVTATYGSASFTWQPGGITYYNSGGFGVYLFIMGLIGLPSGTQTVTLSATGGATINDLAGNTLSYLNVGSFGDVYSNNGSGTNLSLSGITSATGRRVAAGFAGLNHVLGSFSQTVRWSQNVTASVPMLIGDAAGASSVGFTASASSDTWGAVGGVLLPSS